MSLVTDIRERSVGKRPRPFLENIRSKRKKSKIDGNTRKRGPQPGLPSIKTVIDNVKHNSIHEWALEQIRRGLEVRDLGLEEFGGFKSTSERYVEHIKSNYRYCQDLLSELKNEYHNIEADPNSQLLIQNKLYQRMRNKLAMLLQVVPFWRYSHIDEGDAREVSEINNVLPQALHEQEFREMQIDMIAQCQTYGTAVGGLFHTNAQGEPEGEQYFECLDPLSFLWSFRATKINGKSSKRCICFIHVDFRRQAYLEKKWGVKITDPSPMIKPENFSILHALAHDGLANIDDDFIPEINIWYDDMTSEPVMQRELTGYEPIKHPETGEDMLDENGNPVTDEVWEDKPITGKLRMKYPDYRLITFCGSTLTYDGQNPYFHGMIPCFKITNTKDGVNFCGLSDPQIGSSTQRVLFDLSNDMVKVIKQAPGIAEIDMSGVDKTDQDSPIKKEGPFYTLRRRRGHPTPVLEWRQPPMISQDYFLFLANLDRDLDDLIGSQPVSIGNASASDSGIKVETEDDKVLRFHTPITEDMKIMVQQIAKMWLLNMYQFHKYPRPYKYQNPDTGKQGYTMFQGNQMFNNSQLLGKIFIDKLQLVKSIPVDVIPASYFASNRRELQKYLIELKGVLGDGLPNYSILKRADDPDLVDEGMRQERMMLMQQRALELQNEMLEAAKAQGLFEPGGNGTGGPATKPN